MSKRGSKSAIFIGEVKSFRRKPKEQLSKLDKKRREQMNEKYYDNSKKNKTNYIDNIGFIPQMKFLPFKKIKSFTHQELIDYVDNLKNKYDKLVLKKIDKEKAKSFFGILNINVFSRQQIFEYILEIQTRIRLLEIEDFKKNKASLNK